MQNLTGPKLDGFKPSSLRAALLNQPQQSFEPPPQNCGNPKSQPPSSSEAPITKFQRQGEPRTLLECGLQPMLGIRLSSFLRNSSFACLAVANRQSGSDRRRVLRHS